MLQVMIAGRAVKDGTLRFTADGTPVLGWTIATDVGYGDKKHGVFIDCSLWGKRAEALDPYIKKGGNMTVIGEGDLRKWESDGKSGSNITCKVSEVTLQGGKPEAPAQQQEGFRQPSAPESKASDFTDDDLPF